MGYLPIEDHGIIGDLHTAALVGTDGTIDWMCLPAFDSPSVFASIPDDEKGGHFVLTEGLNWASTALTVGGAAGAWAAGARAAGLLADDAGGRAAFLVAVGAGGSASLAAFAFRGRLRADTAGRGGENRTKCRWPEEELIERWTLLRGAERRADERRRSRGVPAKPACFIRRRGGTRSRGS